MLHGAHASGPSAPTSAAARRANRSRCAAAASPSPLPPPGCGLVESSRGSRPDVEAWVASALGAGAPSPSVVAATALGLAGSTRRQGKVRDVYDCGDCVVAVTTDRLSAFDRVLCCVPLKGRALNQTAAWWFARTAHLVPNAVLAVPHPNVTIMRRCDVFPVEFVMRGYLTGSTSTSIWTAYARGERAYCGHALPDGLAQGDALPAALLTPTTKAEDHDEVLSAAEVLSRGLASAAGWAAASRAAHALFAFGQAEAARRGLILVDTKYEFGVCPVSGEVVLVDEVHTPDSSRYWVASTYAARRAAGLQPESVDKEFVRAWFAGRCDPYGPAPLPAAPADLVAELARRYVLLHDTITGERLALPQEGGEGAGGSEEVMRAATVAALARLRAPGGALAAAAAARATR